MYNIKMVAKLLGLPPVTIRAWETRYSVVHPIRSEGGHRLYSDEDVEDLRWLHKQTSEKGLSISQAAQLLKKQKESMNATLYVNTTNVSPSTYLSLQDDLYDAWMNVELEKAKRIVDLGFSMYQLEDMLHKVLVPLMIRVGDEWEQGVISVAQEHMISEFVRQRLMQLFGSFHINQTLPKVIATCPAGERHEIGLLLFSLFLRRKGLDVIYLGVDTPVDGMTEMLNRTAADLLCLSLTDAERLKDAIVYINHLLAARPQLKIVLGGKGFHALDDHHPFRHFLIGDHIEHWESWYQQAIMNKLIGGSYIEG